LPLLRPVIRNSASAAPAFRYPLLSSGERGETDFRPAHDFFFFSFFSLVFWALLFFPFLLKETSQWVDHEERGIRGLATGGGCGLVAPKIVGCWPKRGVVVVIERTSSGQAGQNGGGWSLATSQVRCRATWITDREGRGAMGTCGGPPPLYASFREFRSSGQSQSPLPCGKDNPAGLDAAGSGCLESIG